MSGSTSVKMRQVRTQVDGFASFRTPVGVMFLFFSIEMQMETILVGNPQKKENTHQLMRFDVLCSIFVELSLHESSHLFCPHHRWLQCYVLNVARSIHRSWAGPECAEAGRGAMLQACGNPPTWARGSRVYRGACKKAVHLRCPKGLSRWVGAFGMPFPDTTCLGLPYNAHIG